MKKYRLFYTPEYKKWLQDQSNKDIVQIEDRFHRISEAGHFGDHKSVSEDNSLWELRWKNGRRVYYSYLIKEKILVLLGGNKNGQEKDIKKAQNLLSKVIGNQES